MTKLLALCLYTLSSMLIFASICFAQVVPPFQTGVTKVAYEFDEQPTWFNNGEIFIETAANNYGVWAVDGSNWQLNSNSLQEEDLLTDPDKIIPRGIIAEGHANDPEDLDLSTGRVVANLKGSVRFVWVNADGDGFEIQGFDDGQIGQTQLDPKFTGLNVNSANRNLVRIPIRSFNDILPFGGNSLRLGETLQRENFDVAMDTRFLYITWASKPAVYVPPSDDNWTIHSVAVDLVSGNIVGGVQNPMSGRRPTNSGPNGEEILLNGSTLLLGTSSSQSSTYGQNTIIANVNSWIIQNSGSSVALDINENYWGRGPWTSLSLVQPTGTSHGLFVGGVTYNSNPQFASSPIGRTFTPTCGTAFEPSTAPRLENEAFDENDFTCEDWFFYGRSLNKEDRFSEAFDTMKAYIYSCHTPWIKPAFGQLNTAVQYMSLDNNRWRDYREWLKTVLYLNQVDDAYYCGAVRAFMSTFQYLDPERGMDYNGEISMIDYVLSTGKCLEDTTFFRNARRDLRISQIRTYHDTVKNPSATPLDTAKVNLHDIGLGILYGPATVNSDPTSVSSLIALLSVNPTAGVTELKLDATRGTSLTIGLYDLLGTRFIDLGMRWYDAGPHSLPIDVSSLPSGTYYVRIATSLGDVQTLKLVKQ